jgi:hypothetical protein
VLHRRTLAEVRGAGIATGRLAKGSELRSGRLRLDVLWPPAELLAGPHRGQDPNQLAIVMLARWRRFSMLLTADAEAEATPLDPGPVDVLKVAHHGSDDAGLGGLLDRTRPRLAVISVGADNPFGHPTPATLATLAAHGVATLRTDLDGTVGHPARGLNESTNRYWGYVAFALSDGAPRPMDVKVHSKRGQWRSLSAIRASVLGDGLLVRARSTSLVLLGVTAAVGLAMVALALNQGWPLIAGAPIPGFGDRHEAIGKAAVAASAGAPQNLGAGPAGGSGQPVGSPVRQGKGVGGTPVPAGSGSPVAPGVVVSHSTPAGLPGGGPTSPEGSPGTAPSSPPSPAQQPAAPPPPESEPVSTPAAPTAGPTPQSAPESSAPSPAALVSGENATHDHGHRFGRGSSGRSYGHSRGRGDSEASSASESSGAIESAPEPPVESAPDSSATESAEESDGQPSAPAWSHGGGHGYGHDHDHGHW